MWNMARPASASASRPASLLRNPISLLGILVAAASTAFGLPMMILDIIRPHTSAYVAVLIYLVLPLAAMAGVALMLAGMVWERRRRRRHPDRPVPPLPRLDLNRPAYQAALLAGAFGLMVILALLSVTGYRAYHFTESVRFCGVVCHQVMKPEYTTYQHSPHARVACTACHVGPGAEWYVRSKLSGLYQVYAVAANRYPRPIPTPVHHLRPAQETCEQCHWPAKFFGAQQRVFTHVLSDEANSPWQIQMLVRVGGGDPTTGATDGIHWHMNIRSDIDYIASDEARQIIPWVRVTDREGRVTEYASTEQPLSSEQLATTAIRRMDCVDCHNRPSHIFPPPDRAVEQAFNAGRLDRRLPYLKREAVRLLAASYATEAEARDAIAKGLAEFYRTQYPEVARERASAVQDAAHALQALYSRTIFPEMRADWRAHPDHAGHLHAQGCFRCHDGLHVSRDGRVLTKDCNACHTILFQGPPEALAASLLKEQSFQHPVDVGMDVTELSCSGCHTGATIQ
jgi:hypothetical protein